jgi:hypothetical protein
MTSTKSFENDLRQSVRQFPSPQRTAIAPFPGYQ